MLPVEGFAVHPPPCYRQGFHVLGSCLQDEPAIRAVDQPEVFGTPSETGPPPSIFGPVLR